MTPTNAALIPYSPFDARTFVEDQLFKYMQSNILSRFSRLPIPCKTALQTKAALRNLVYIYCESDFDEKSLKAIKASILKNDPFTRNWLVLPG